MATILFVMLSHDFCGFRFAFLFAMSEINTVPSRGNSGVSFLPCAGVRVEERPRLDTSVNCSATSSLLGGVRLDALPLGAVPFGAAATAEALLLSGTLEAAADEALAWSSIGKRLSACTCARCAARTC